MLRGLGTAIALPWLEGMMPSGALGDTTATAAGAAGAAAKAVAGPRRVAWMYVPNGIHMPNWTPTTVGANFELTPTLMPLAAFKDRMMVLTGLICDKANANGDGPGDHARAMSAYLTASQPRKTEGANIKVGMSADQAVAERIGHLTKFPSLEMGIEEGKQVGRCDSGYSCAYSHNISWKSETTPLVKDCNPQSVFDRLFGNGDPRESAEARAKREAQRKSVLDYILADANTLDGQLGTSDKRKVDEYMTSIREIELRLSRTALDTPTTLPAGAVRPPAGVPRLYPDHAKLMLDMMVLAFQGDLTRVATFPFASEGSDQTYPWADAPVPHHGTSHHMGDPAKQALLAKINTFHIQHFAYLLQKLDAIQEGNGSILDNSLIAYGSGNSDGQRHNHDNLPVLLMGKGGGSVATGRHVKFDSDDVPISNLWLAMMERAGAPHDKFGDSTGKLALS
jgi:hypothetical protein